jgi:hypothetical protein
MKPVAVKAIRGPSSDAFHDAYDAQHVPRFWETDSFSAGLERSFSPAATRHHFISGAQKKTVLGPAEVKTLRFSKHVVNTRRLPSS